MMTPEEFERAQRQAQLIDRHNSPEIHHNGNGRIPQIATLCLGLTTMSLSIGFAIVCYTGLPVPPALAGLLSSALTALSILAVPHRNGGRK